MGVKTKFYFSDCHDTYLVWRVNESGLMEKLSWDGWKEWNPTKEEMEDIVEWDIEDLDEDDMGYWEDYYNPETDEYGRYEDEY